MKITYRFVDGTTSTVEVDEEIGNVILDSRRKEHANNERERYHSAYSLDNDDYDCPDLFEPEADPLWGILQEEESDYLSSGLARLTPTERRRLLMLASGMKIAEIARSEGASFNTVKDSICTAREKMKKFL